MILYTYNNTVGGTKGSKKHLKMSAIRAPALLSLLQDLRTNIVKNTTVTVYELIGPAHARPWHDLY